MKYVTQRGQWTDQRPFRDLSLQERDQILHDVLKLRSAEIRQRWNISSQTLNHLKYHYRKRLEQIEDKHFKEFGL